MILIIKSTHSLSTILTDRSSGWWATPWVSIHLHSHSLIIRIIRTQFIHSHDNEYNRFKREGFMMEHSSDPTDQLSQSLFSTQWSDFNTPSLTIPFVSLIHLIFSLVMKDRLLFVSIHTNLCPTNSLHCYHLYDCETSPYCFIIHSSIHTHGY